MTKEEKNIYMKKWQAEKKLDPKYAEAFYAKDRERCKIYRENNKDKIAEARNNNKEVLKEKKKNHYLKNRDYYIKKQLKYHYENLDKVKANKDKYYQQNKSRLKEYNASRRKQSNALKKEKYHNNPLDKLKNIIRSRITTCLKQAGYTKRSKLTTILGCSFEEFKKHVGEQFIESMNWDNIHCDHIIPISLGKTEGEILLLCNYRNYRPCFITENLKKHAKIDIELINKYGLDDVYKLVTQLN